MSETTGDGFSRPDGAFVQPHYFSHQLPDGRICSHTLVTRLDGTALVSAEVLPSVRTIYLSPGKGQPE